MATLANASAGATDEFGGNEFSNNLFSDLAPLLTLFGEQVTKQFLSMSLGWADNILLAMGPLGIMTIIVSAIRVGGVRQLKAIVGRARESQSTAEQELLSSTSADVCELWSGKEVVRLIGSPAGMKNLVVVGKKGDRDGASLRVVDIATACRDDLLRSPGLGTRDLNSLSETTLNELSEAAPNLALNVKNATAKPFELWVCATIGVALQGAAIVFPGLATYHWKFGKAGTPVPAYGYPCFLIGTLLVIIGVAACGHVIEGITTENHFTAETQGSRKTGEIVKKVVRLQRSCTVSDQHFASFAIHNSPDDLDVRTSRLNKRDYSSLAATATIAAVVGFVAQFIGLRALHWSATIVQLGVTLIMTGIRAYVRRGLATNPICSSILDGHEAAWFALQISRDLDRPTTPSTMDSSEEGTSTPLPRPLLVRIKHMMLARPDTRAETDRAHIPAVWELPSLQLRMKMAILTDSPSIGQRSRRAFNMAVLTDSPSVARRGRRRNFNLAEEAQFEKLCAVFFPSQRLPVSSILATKTPERKKPLGLETTSQSHHGAAMEIRLHGNIQALMPQHDDATAVAGLRLAILIERLAATCAEIDAIQWRAGDDASPSSISISIPVADQTLGGSDMEKAVHLLVRLKASETNRLEEEIPNSRAWVLEDRNQLQSVLALWQYTLAERQRALQEIYAINPAAFRQATPGTTYEEMYKGAAYVRVVGYASELSGGRKAPQQDWLGKRVFDAPSNLGVLGLDHYMEKEMSLPTSHEWPVFGAFVSMLSCKNGTKNRDHYIDHYIYTDQRTGLVMQCAHEILSLFFLALASMIEKVGGETTRLPASRPTDRPERDQTRAPRLMVNSVFRELAEVIVNSDMAHDITEAYTLIIPAFSHYGLLPTQADDEIVAGPVVDEAAQLDDEYRNDNLDGDEGAAVGGM